MKHKILILTLVLMFSATAALAQKTKVAAKSDEKASVSDLSVMNYTERVVKLWVEKDEAQFAKMLSVDFEALGPDGVMSKTEFLAQAQRWWDMKPMKGEGGKVKMIGKDAAIITAYIKFESVAEDGKRKSDGIWTTSVVSLDSSGRPSEMISFSYSKIKY